MFIIKTLHSLCRRTNGAASLEVIKEVINHIFFNYLWTLVGEYSGGS